MRTMKSRALLVQFNTHSRSVALGNLCANGVESDSMSLHTTFDSVGSSKIAANVFLCFVFTF